MRNWLPGVPTLPSSHDGGSMAGIGLRWVWHTYEAPYQLTALQGAKSLVRAGNEVHFVFHPVSGDIVQVLPANRAGRGLVNKPGGVQTNRQGLVCIQVEVVAFAKRPWTLDLTPAGRQGLAKLVTYGRELGIPDVWPAGPPPAYPSGRSSRSVSDWNKSGHFGHSQVPENSHGDPGAIDTKVLFSAAPQPTEEDMPTAEEIGKAIAGQVVATGVEGRVTLGVALARTQSEMMRLTDQVANAAELQYAIYKGDPKAVDAAIARIRARDVKHPGGKD